jgi:hypothetical protein
MTSARATVKRVYASGAQAAGRTLERVHLLPTAPPAREHRLRHWAFSLTRAHDSIGISALDVPWWTYRAIEAVEAWLVARPARSPVRAFEWGSGASTLWLARRVDEVHSVEHHRGFGEMIRTHLGDHRGATLDIVEPIASSAPRIGSAKEGHGELDFEAYVRHIDEVGGTFSLIVVDGRARQACLERALDHLDQDGLIVFDNTLRRRYRRAIAVAPVAERRFFGLTPTLPYPDQTSLLTRRCG